ncbi:MAG: nucleotide exchange factor GrpE [bacterium]
MVDQSAPPDGENSASEESKIPPREVKLALEEKWKQEEKWEQDIQGDAVVDNVEMKEAGAGDATVGDATVISPGEFQKAVQERDEYLDHLRRLQAEFDNYRKRVQKEKGELRDLLIQDILFQLLDVMEALERALHPDHESSDVESYRKGVEIVFQKFMAVLKDQGLIRIESVGQPFDPFIHEAIMQTETGAVKPGTVVAEITPGYFLKDRLLRPARVQVSVPPKESQPES